MPAHFDIERSLFDGVVTRLVAIDEVGRGALAGPVTVGAVLIGTNVADPPEGIDDSKKLSPAKRRDYCTRIATWVDGYAIAHVDAARIDDVGIMTALGEGASAAITELGIGSDENDENHDVSTVILLDGKYDFLTPVRPGFQVHTVVGGDGTCASIAAASIVAKEERDALMVGLHDRFPQYGWASNVGYGTRAHRAAIDQFGVSPHHRVSWRLGVTGST